MSDAQFRDMFWKSVFPTAYEPDKPEDSLFGKHYIKPDKFEYGVWTLVARIPDDGGESQSSEIFECRMPAEFYRLKISEKVRVNGRVLPAWSLGTGSGREYGALLYQIALAAAQGMLGVPTDERTRIGELEAEVARLTEEFCDSSNRKES